MGKGVEKEDEDPEIDNKTPVDIDSTKPPTPPIEVRTKSPSKELMNELTKTQPTKISSTPTKEDLLNASKGFKKEDPKIDNKAPVGSTKPPTPPIGSRSQSRLWFLIVLLIGILIAYVSQANDNGWQDLNIISEEKIEEIISGRLDTFCLYQT
uniref:Uncharacterized protein n=1 Tax=Acrobeloides nanus TaxID=290746 RepID=A0A914CDY1_9BILA